jgi:hypothetical protein
MINGELQQVIDRRIAAGRQPLALSDPVWIARIARFDKHRAELTYHVIKNVGAPRERVNNVTRPSPRVLVVGDCVKSLHWTVAE